MAIRNVAKTDTVKNRFSITLITCVVLVFNNSIRVEIITGITLRQIRTIENIGVALNPKYKYNL